MARVLTYLATTTFAAAAIAAGCGGGGSEDTGTGGSGAISGTGGSGINVTGGSEESDVAHTRSLPEGFLSDDGTGTPTYKDPALDISVYDLFADAVASPPSPSFDIVYPLTDTMVPGNLTFIDFQWIGPSGHDKVLVRATAGDSTYHMYLTLDCEGNGACVRNLPSIEFQNLGKNHAGEDVTFQLISTDGSEFASSEPLTLRYSPERLTGVLYYWAAASRNIKRVAFGAEKAADFIVPGQHTEYGCVSCHSVSRDGTTIAFGVSPEHGENIAGIQVAPTKDPSNPMIAPTKGTTPFSESVYETRSDNPDRQGPVDSLGHNVALNPDGSLMAVNATDPPENWPSHLDIRRTGAADDLIASYEVGHSVFGGEKIGIHPEFSPDGSKLVVTLAENNGEVSAWSNTAGSIAVMSVTASGLGPAQVIATPEAGAYHFYPTWSPDGQYVAFMTSWDTAPPGSLNNDHAVMHMVPSGGSTTCPGSGCIELARGTGYTAAEAEAMSNDFGSTWPKFAPFAQGADEQVYFITFSSTRNYGLVPTSGQTQLWMFGVDTSVSGDSSFSPFWLPYQEISDGSLTPYWTEAAPCESDGKTTCEGCLEGEICIVSEEDGTCTCEPELVVR